MQPGLSLYLLLVLGLLIVQPKVSAQTSGTTPQMPATYTISAKSYVRTWEALAPTADPNSLTLTTSLDKARMTTVYLDGLGRPLQTVVKQGSLTSSGSAVDLVSAVVYDPFGREQFKYLPFAASAAGGNTHIDDGFFKLNPFQQQAAFYGAQNGVIAGQAETFFYGETRFEPSPLNRVVKTLSPGDSWIGADKGVTLQYYGNTLADEVRIWNVTNDMEADDFGTYTTPGTYSESELYKNIVIDEHGKQMIEFTDKEGRIILKKSQLLDQVNGELVEDGGSGKAYEGWLCTYYIYDDLGQLRCVIQPKAVEELAKPTVNWQLSATILDELCFRYEYDGRGRMTMKKVPGAGAVYLVYDKRDRLTMTQDANMQTGTKKWLVTIYDDLNRPVKTGLLADANDWTYHHEQATMTSNFYYPFQSEPAAGWELLTETHYDDYSGLPAGLMSGMFPSGYGAYLSAPANDYPEPLVASSAVKGMVTWSRTKILGTSPAQYIQSCNIYDVKGRLIQTQTKNITDGIDITTNLYSFSGKLLATHTKHKNASGTAQTFDIATSNTFDDLGRVTAIKKNVNGGGWTQIASLSYDALGQLKTKVLGADLQALNYDYNIRGWLLGMNRSYVNEPASPIGRNSTKFGFDLGYDKNGLIGTNVPLYNGNIAAMAWKSAGDDKTRKYDFSYDAVNRLTQATFGQRTSGSGSSAIFNTSDGIDYTVENIGYDANGNIGSMWQKGWKVGGSTYVDKLSYTYYPGTNKLQAVADLTGSTDNKLGDFTDKNTTATDYGYDKNGNLITDLNKKVVGAIGLDQTTGGAITYNYLNLPAAISMKTDDNTAVKGTVSYVYDAGGDKLRKNVVDNSMSNKTITTTTTYIGGFIYESRQTAPADPGDYTDRLQFVSMEEGRARPIRDANNTITEYAYDYFIKDHLGNVRMVLTDELKTDPYETLTFEDENIARQNALWENRLGQSIDVVSVRSSVSMNTGQTNAMLVKRSTGSIGATKLLKVMAGDRIHTSIDYYYTSADASSTNGGTTALSSMVSSIANALTYSSAPSNLIHGEEGVISSQLNNNDDLSTAVNTAANTNPANTSQQAPKAYLCVLFFDERFQFDKDHSTVIPVGYAPNQRITIDRRFSDAIDVPENGYAYVYFTNESDEMVYFDNFYLSHERGGILEETHYYPFGLVQQGISSKAVAFGGAENKRKFNDGTELENKEFSDGSGLELYSTEFRSYDAQIGRFHQIDPLAEVTDNWSPYSFVQNNPILYNDPLGLDTFKVNVPLPANVKPGQVINVPNPGGGTSSYVYDPTNPNADAQGLVPNGMIAPEEENVTVVGTRKKTDDQQQSTKPWMDVAWKENAKDVKEISGAKANPNILLYHKSTGGFKSDEIPWCSSFVNYCMTQGGVKGTNSASALSWRKWGQSSSVPLNGSVAVINWGEGKGHVGFVVGKKGAYIALLGGNQGDRIKVALFKATLITTYRLPSNYTITKADSILQTINGSINDFKGTR